MKPGFRYFSQSNAKQATPKQAMVFSLVFAVVGILLTIFWGIPTARNAVESKNWPTTDGRITISDVSKNYNSDKSHIIYRAKVAYNYYVNGSLYTGSTVAFGDYDSSDPGHASGVVSRYPVGKNVAVYYNPNNPETSVLESGASWNGFVGLMVSIGFTAIGIVGFLFNRKRLHTQNTISPTAEAFPSQPDISSE